MLNRLILASIELVLNRVIPSDDRCGVGEVMHLEERETLSIVKFAVEVDGLDLEVKAFEYAEELGEDAAGGVAIL